MSGSSSVHAAKSRQSPLPLLCVLLGALVWAPCLPSAAEAYNPPPIRHVFVLVDENESASTVFGTGSAAPYLSQTLVAEGAYLPSFYAIGHNSLDNYIAMVSGQAPNPSTSADCPSFVNFPADPLSAAGQENGQGCVYPADVPTLMHELDAAGLSWRAYEDGMGSDPTREPATCGHPPVGAQDNTETVTAQDQYMTHHDPFVYFHSVIDNQTECNANVVNVSRLSADLQTAATTPNFAFVTPSACNDGHTAPCPNGQPGGLTQADSFLRSWVPVIVSAPAFQQNGMLIITFDEAASDSTACCGELPGPFDAASQIQPGGNGPGGGDVGAVLLSPAIAPGTRSIVGYNHYSLLASIEDLFGLPRIGDALGMAAFGPDVYTRPTGVVAAGTGSGTPGGVGGATSAPGGKRTKPGDTSGGGRVISPALLRLLIALQISPSGRAARIASLSKSRGCLLRFIAPEAGRVLVQWYRVQTRRAGGGSGRTRSRRLLIASGHAVFRSAGTRMIGLKLTAAGERLLKHAKRLTLTAKGTFTPPRGAAVSTKITFALRGR